MLELSQVDRIAAKAASSVLKKLGVSRVFSRPTLDSDGHEALDVTVVIRHETPEITGDQALDTIVKIGRDLRDSGEERHPIVWFSTEQELAADAELDRLGDTES